MSPQNEIESKPAIEAVTVEPGLAEHLARQTLLKEIKLVASAAGRKLTLAEMDDIALLSKTLWEQEHAEFTAKIDEDMRRVINFASKQLAKSASVYDLLEALFAKADTIKNDPRSWRLMALYGDLAFDLPNWLRNQLSSTPDRGSFRVMVRGSKLLVLWNDKRERVRRRP